MIKEAFPLKYWRGYLVAAIVAACTWGLQQFAKAHSVLVDMVYPYVTRMMQDFLAQWSDGVPFAVWQVALYGGIAIALAVVVVMVVRHWNPIRVIGWLLTAVSLVSFLNTVAYGLNQYAGPLSDDIRMESAEYAWSVDELKQAATYYRDQANTLANQIPRSGSKIQEEEFDTLAKQAADGFEKLVYEHGYSVFAGSTAPVKALNTLSKRTTGKMVALTGEAMVNPKLPMTAMPFAMCHEMSHRMCIVIDRDADMGAFLACTANESVYFQYSGYLNAYRACRQALESIDSGALQTLVSGENSNLKQDLREYEKYFGSRQVVDGGFCDLLVVWYVQTQVLPLQEEDDGRFDPLDESQVDLSGIVNAG